MSIGCGCGNSCCRTRGSCINYRDHRIYHSSWGERRGKNNGIGAAPIRSQSSNRRCCGTSIQKCVRIAPCSATVGPLLNSPVAASGAIIRNIHRIPVRAYGKTEWASAGTSHSGQWRNGTSCSWSSRSYSADAGECCRAGGHVKLAVENFHDPGIGWHGSHLYRSPAAAERLIPDTDLGICCPNVGAIRRCRASDRPNTPVGVRGS